MARRGGMSRSCSAGVGWLRPGAAASRFGRPGCAVAGWARFDRGLAHDRRVPRLSRLERVDRGRAGQRGGWRLPGADRLVGGPGRVRRPEATMILAVWLLSLPFRFLAALGLRRSVILACLFVLAVTAYGAAEDLGLIDPPAQAAPARRPTARQPTPNRAAVADIPAGYLRLYRAAGARYRIPWPVLAAIGKVESDHGRARLPGVRSGSNWAGACGPMQLGCVPGSRAGNAWAHYGHGRPHDPANAIPAAARYLVDHGARHHLDRALVAYNPSWPYVARAKALARRYTRGGGRR